MEGGKRELMEREWEILGAERQPEPTMVLTERERGAR